MYHLNHKGREREREMEIERCATLWRSVSDTVARWRNGGRRCESSESGGGREMRRSHTHLPLRVNTDNNGTSVCKLESSLVIIAGTLRYNSLLTTHNSLLTTRATQAMRNNETITQHSLWFHTLLSWHPLLRWWIGRGIWRKISWEGLTSERWLWQESYQRQCSSRNH